MEGLFQPSHLLLIFLVALILFGPKKLPELGKGIGEGFRALNESMKASPSNQARQALPTASPASDNSEIKG